MDEIRKKIHELVRLIDPVDEMERIHKEDALDWIESDDEIFRIEKPDKPPKHLVSYFAVVDKMNESILLVDHIKAELWLPPGGHVERDEDPRVTVEREALEELGIVADFLDERPVFVTVTTTVGKTAGHKDVSLWYLISGRKDDPVRYDPGEFNGYRWFGFDEVLDRDVSEFDPHMHRFVRKLKKNLNN